MTDQALIPIRPAKGKSVEPWRQRLIRSLLYGRNVDRAAKARARRSSPPNHGGSG